MTERLAAKMRSIFCNRIPASKLNEELTEEVKAEFEKLLSRDTPVEPKVVDNYYLCPACECKLPHYDEPAKFCIRCGQRFKFIWQQY